jgi:hypothetical protein
VRRSFVLAALILAASASASAQEEPEFNAMCGDTACRVERVPAKWQLLSVGSDPRTLKLVYESGGCRRGDGRATVHETKSRIRISVDEGEVVALDTPDRQVVCPAILLFRKLSVVLRRPVAGRRIVGGPRIRGGGMVGRYVEKNGRLIPLAPRVIDLAFGDARAVLHSQDFEVRRFGARRGRVTFQSPRPGRRAPNDTVGLTLGRRAFDARALERCLEAAGIPTVAGRPGPGDEAAPDLELVLSHVDAGAFVALYADPARARENAPAIGRRIRAGGGLMERLGRVTIAWVKPPAVALREAAHRCVAGARP